MTGAAGVLGREIVSVLKGAGHQVLASGRVPDDEMDCRWDLATDDAPQPNYRPETVIHSAASIGRFQQPISDAVSLFDVNVSGTLRVANWCVVQGVKRLILISGAIVYGTWEGGPKSETDPVSPWAAGPYAVSKWCGEQAALLVQYHGVELTVLRLSSLYGIGYRNGLIQRFLRDGLEHKSIHLRPPFDDSFDLLHIRDAARSILNAVDLPKAGLWNVGSGSTISIDELATICAASVKAEVTYSDETNDRPARVLNWVNDQLARRELNHNNRMELDSSIAEMADSIASNQETRSRG